MADDVKQAAEAKETRGFEAEVSRLLHMMVHSVYSDREIFLRELISNASDACDKLRYEALTNPALTADDPAFKIAITVDEAARTLTVSDNGVGMSHDDLIANLGTIARSGTAGFAEKLTGDAKKDVQLIGQFGVGFYSVFMVADKVTVTSKRAGEDVAHVWESSGEGSYTVAPAGKATRGTDIVLHIKEDADEFLKKFRLETIIRTYSDHIGVPITLAVKAKDQAEEAEAAAVNEGSALWTRPKADVTEEQYKEFYHHVAHAWDDPALTLHYKAEGMQEYTVLLYVPGASPMDLFDPARKPKVKLYVKKVFITDDTGELIPGWLRFLKGVVDSQDLPLNVSREMLQNNPLVTRMSKAIVKRVLGELEKLAESDKDKFEAIWANFGAVLKEGIYEDFERREQLLKLARFKSTNGDGWTTLADYVSRMKEGQKAIYYVTGPDEAAARRLPQLEGFKAKGVEVLVLADAVDEFWLQMVTEHEGHAFQSITRGGCDLKDIKGEDKPEDAGKPKATEGAMTALTVLMKEVLGDTVKEVRASDRLIETLACLVADESAMDMHLERLLKAHKKLDHLSARILEVNPGHPLIVALAAKAGDKGAADSLKDAVHLVYDQARILEGEVPEDPTAFARRVGEVMVKALG
ncbi:molecular chaperone HtpG [Pseudokordiimonas caeni]|uniref:molecular chaperone HtpG n=1 Tax=Pseudokordiimonas caeni TaxID=2997908 RepID=UPI0028115854|nr:molecular chaperone HtpG [Pseudokordiimonas caeni]